MEHFDKAGFIDANGDGWRDLPSGTDFTLVIDLTNWGNILLNTPFLDVYKENLKDVGVQVLINNVHGTPKRGSAATMVSTCSRRPMSLSWTCGPIPTGSSRYAVWVKDTRAFRARAHGTHPVVSKDGNLARQPGLSLAGDLPQGTG